MPIEITSRHPVKDWHEQQLSGRSYDQIAAAYGVTRGVVAGALHRFRGLGKPRPRRTATHFACGHRRIPSNIYTYADGSDHCAICNKARAAKWRNENRPSRAKRSD